MKRVLYILLVLIVVVLAGAAAAPFLIPSSTIASLAADQVREATGRELVIEGDIERRVYPSLGITAGPVTISNAEWASDPVMASIDKMVVDVKTSSLWSGGPTEIERIELISPTVSLEIGPNGEENWTFSEAAQSGQDGRGGNSGDADGLGMILAGATITDGAFRFTDQRSGQVINLADIDIAASQPEAKGPVSLKGSAQWNERPITISADIDSVAKLQSGDAIAASFAFDAPGASAAYEGSATPPSDGAAPIISGQIAAILSEDEAETAWLRQSLPPALAPLTGVDLTGTIDFNAEGAQADLNGGLGFNGRHVALTGAVSGGADWSSGGPLNTALDLVSDGLFNAKWKGALVLPEGDGGDPKVTGVVSASIKDLRGTADWAGIGPIDAPEGTFRALDVRADVAYANQTISAEVDRLKLDKTRAEGKTLVRLGGDKPMINLTLKTGALDLRPFTKSEGGGDGSGGGASSGGGDGWSNEPIDLSGLRAVDAAFDIDAESVTTDTVKLGRTSIQGTLQNGKLEATLREVALYKGGATGSATVDASSDTPAIAAKFDANALNMLPLLRDVAGLEALEGLGRFNLDVNSAGGSMQALMSSLNGNGAIRFEDGALIGVNLAAIARNLRGALGGDTSQQKTDFAELSGSFDIENGVMKNLDLSMLGPLVRLTGVGEVDLGGQTLDYRLTPKAVANLVGQGGGGDESGVAFPIMVSGPWSNLSFRPDLQGAIEGLLANPEGALDNVRGLVEGAGDGGALREVIGGALGGGNDAGGLQDAVGGALGGAAGGGGGEPAAPANPITDLLGGGGQSGGGQNSGGAAPETPPLPNPADALKGLFGN